MFLIANIVTTSKALVTRSDALVPSSDALVTTRIQGNTGLGPLRAASKHATSWCFLKYPMLIRALSERHVLFLGNLIYLLAPEFGFQFFTPELLLKRKKLSLSMPFHQHRMLVFENRSKALAPDHSLLSHFKLLSHSSMVVRL